MADESKTGLDIIASTADLLGANLFDPYQINDRVYKEQHVDIDGYHFTNCAFIRCQLSTVKGNFSLNKCYFQASNVHFSGNAQRIVKVISMFVTYTWPDGLHAEIDADGAVTVK